MTQAPLNTTIDDFWNMVWQQNSQRIFMLCNCQELDSTGRLRTKCVEYWNLSNNQSNNQSNKFQSNKFSIKIISSINIDNTNNTVVLRTLSLRKHNGNNSEKEERLISHYQYVGWPDFGIPSDTSSFMALIRIYLSHSNSNLNSNQNSNQNSKQNPNNNDIIHCSAGIGRSGCFVAVILGILHPHLSLFEIVQQIRKCRNGAVQGLEQYQFINRCFELVRSREGNKK
jgi:protein tyrosine phosphatase